MELNEKMPLLDRTAKENKNETVFWKMVIIPGFNHLNRCCIVIFQEVRFPVCATTAWKIYKAGKFIWQVDSGFKRYRCRFRNGIQGIGFPPSADKSLILNNKNPGRQLQMFVNLEPGPKRWWRDSLHLPRPAQRMPESSWMMTQRSADYIASIRGR